MALSARRFASPSPSAPCAGDAARRPSHFSLAVTAAFTALVLAIGCSSGNTPGASDDAGGVDAGADVEDVKIATPKLDLKIDANVVIGNVPLEVTFTLDMGDNDPEDFLISWDFGDGVKLSSGPDTKASDLLVVAHTFKYRGEFPTRATVTWKKNLKVSKTITKDISVLRPSALSLSVIEVLSPTTAFPGDAVQLKFDILNDGQGYEKEMATCIYMSTDEKIDDKDPLVHTELHPKGIASGVNGTAKISYTKEKPLTFNIPQDAKDGNWLLIVKTDCKDVVPDQNKVDNVGIATSLIQIDTVVLAPSDLTITPPSFDGTSAYSPGDSITYSLQLKNLGKGEAKNFNFGVFLSKDKKLNFDKTGKPADVDMEEYLNKQNKDIELTDPANSKVQALGGGASLPIFRGFALPDLPNGTYYLIAKIDTHNTVSETKETNNIAVSANTLSVKKVVVQGTNLNLVDMVVSPKGTYLGGTIAVNWHVKNDGTLASPKAEATVFFCPTPSLSKATCVINKTTTTIPALAAGQEKKGFVSIKINPKTPVQDWYIYFQLDPNKKIDELNEGDNTKAWTKPPLKVTATANIQIKPANVGYHPTSLKAGDTLKLSHKVINSGTTGSSQTTTYVVMSPNNNISWANRNQLIVIDKLVEPGVEGLEVGYRSASVVVPEGLDHKIKKFYVGVILDPEGKETKDNHNDNALGASQILEVTDTKGGCYQDAFDLAINNDSKGNSKVIKPGVYKKLAICKDEEDWFAVNVDKGHSLFVTIASEDILWTSPVPSDIDIDVYDPDGKLLDSVKGLGALKKAVALTVAKGGKHYLRVYPHTPAVRAHFELNVQVTPPPAGTDLFANGLIAGPASTFPGGLVKTKMQLTNVGATAAGSFVVRYVLSKDAVIDSSDTKLKDVTFSSGLAGATSMAVAETLVLPVVKGGKYYIGALIDPANKIKESNDKNNAVASNTIQLNPTISCATDAFTGNHTVADAAQLPPETKSYTKLNVCPGLEDWFALKLPQGKAFKVKVNWTQKKDAGIVGVQIVDASGTGVLAGSANPLKTEANLPYLQVGGTYYIHTYILPIGNKPAQPYDYGLEVTVSEPDPSDVCLADAYESNNSYETAQELGCGLANMSLCLGDEDWFYLTLAKGENIKVNFSHKGTGFGFNLYNNPKLPPIQSLTDNGTLNFTAPAAGKYYMQATYKTPGKKPGGTFNYQLKVDGGKGVDLLPTIKSLFPGQVIQGEDAYVTMNVSNECKDDAGTFHYGYYFSTDNKLDKSDVLMLEKKLDGGLKAKTAKDVDDKVALPVGAKPGPAYVIVKVDSKEEIKESQELNNTAYEALSVVKLCLADAMEPNGTPTIAKPLFTGTVTDLSLCPYEFDWYSFEAKAGETITLTASFDQKAGDLDMRLYEVAKFGKAVATSATKSAPEQIVFTAPKSTKYFVRVNGFAGASNSYSLAFCKKMGGSCVDCTSDIHCAGKGAFCGAGGVCKVMNCTVGDDSTCNDGNGCTTDTCVPKQGCTNVAVKAGSECADGDLCSLGESCDAKGVCVAPTGSNTQTEAWLGGGKAGDMIAVSPQQQLFVGSVTNSKGEAAGHAELYQDGAKRWQAHPTETGYKVAHLASAVTRSDAGEIVAIGWLAKAAGLPAGATVSQTAILPKDSAAADAAWMVRIDGVTGKVVATTTWLGAGLNAIVDAGKGSFVAAGWSQSGTKANAQEAWVVKFDAKGQIAWQAMTGGAANDSFTDLIAAPTGGWYAVGVDATATGTTGGLVSYITPAGKIAWSKSYAGAKGSARFAAVTANPKGGLIAVGSSDDGGSTLLGWAAWLATPATATAATLSASQSYAGATPQDTGYKGATVAWFTDVVANKDGSLVVAGATGALSGAKGGMDAAAWLIAADKKVTKTWAWGGNGHDTLAAVITRLGQVRAFGTLLADQVTLSQWYEALVSPPKANCDDANPCTVDACAAKTGCSHTPVKDGTSCGTGLTCSAGVCK